MIELGGGCRIIGPREGEIHQEGPQCRRVTIGPHIEARDIVQTVRSFDIGLSFGHVNPTSEEVHYVIAGRGAAYIDGYRHEIEPGSAVYVPASAACCFENHGPDILEIVSVCCPRASDAQYGLPPRTTVDGAAPPSPGGVVHERDRTPMPSAGRIFKLLADTDLGCTHVTQFVGSVPPSEAPRHSHQYEEAIYIIEGAGSIWADGKAEPIEAGTCIYLPRGVQHSMKVDQQMRLLGVYHPASIPTDGYSSDDTTAAAGEHSARVSAQ